MIKLTKEQIEEIDTKCMAMYLFARVFNSSFKKWMAFYNQPGREQQKKDDLPYVNWLEEEIKETQNKWKKILNMLQTIILNKYFI